LARDPVAASEVSLLDSRNDLEIGSLSRLSVLAGVRDGGIFCVGICESADGLEVHAVRTGFVVRLETGRD